MNMKIGHLNVNEATLSQRQFCSAAGLDMAMTNTLIARGILRVDETVGRHVKGGRRFKPVNAWRARIMKESVERHKLPLADAAEIARVAERLARKGRWIEHWERALNAHRPFVAAYMAVTWSSGCYDAELFGGDQTGRPDFSSPSLARFLQCSFLISPVAHFFFDVGTKCMAMMAENKKA
jgi:hypothetical protein